MVKQMDGSARFIILSMSNKQNWHFLREFTCGDWLADWLTGICMSWFSLILLQVSLPHHFILAALVYYSIYMLSSFFPSFIALFPLSNSLYYRNCHLYHHHSDQHSTSNSTSTHLATPFPPPPPLLTSSNTGENSQAESFFLCQLTDTRQRQ